MWRLLQWIKGGIGHYSHAIRFTGLTLTFQIPLSWRIILINSDLCLYKDHDTELTTVPLNITAHGCSAVLFWTLILSALSTLLAAAKDRRRHYRVVSGWGSIHWFSSRCNTASCFHARSTYATVSSKQGILKQLQYILSFASKKVMNLICTDRFRRTDTHAMHTTRCL